MLSTSLLPRGGARLSSPALGRHRSPRLVAEVLPAFPAFAAVADTSISLESLGNDIFIFLAASVLVVPLSKSLNVTPVLGFLALGCAIGPFGLGLFSNSEADVELGDFGIVFLLFIEGLQLSPDRVQKLGSFFKLGLAQFLLTIAAITAANLYLGPQILPAAERFIPLDDSIVRPILTDPVLAFCLAGAGALSSSAFVLPVLKQKGWEARADGTAALAVLLLQDLLVAPLLVILPLVAGSGPQGPQELGLLGAKATLGFGAVLVAGSLALRQIFAVVAATRSSETFVAAALLVAVGMGAAAQELGLSTTTGAFAAGVLLASSQYRSQIEADIKPFEGILLGIFFMSAGASLDPSLCIEEWPTLLAGILAFLGAKVAILFTAGAFAFGLSRAEAIRIALLLAGGGEFAFIVFKLADDLSLLPGSLGSLLTASVILSMSLTPLLGEAAAYIGELVERIDATSAANAKADALFDAIDVNGDGVIELDELRTYLLEQEQFSAMAGSATTAASATAAAAASTPVASAATPSTDGNSAADSSADDSEPTAAAATAGAALSSSSALRIGELFERLDTDSDGVLSRDELRAGYLDLVIGDLREAAKNYATAGQMAKPRDATSAATAMAADAVVVCGYGEMGQRVCDVLANAEQGEGGAHDADVLRDMTPLPSGVWSTQFVAFDRNPSRASVGLAKQQRVVYGDGASPDLIKAAGIEKPRAIVITYAADNRCLEATRRLRAAYPQAPIIVRARTMLDCEPLLQAGATEVVVESVETTVRVASLLGATGDTAGALLRTPGTSSAAVTVDSADGDLWGGGPSGRAPADATLPPFPRDQLEALAAECGITLTQVNELYSGFATLEANGNGDVTLDAVREMLMRVSVAPIDEAALLMWMTEADTDGSNCLSFFEYVRIDTKAAAATTPTASSTESRGD